MATAGATMSGNRKHFDISQLPSLKDGMTVKEESDKRRKTCRFIEEAGRVLKLPRVAVATAMVFFHRFYAKHSFSEHDRFEVAVACLVLAAKTEESPKKLNTVIDECYKLKVRGMQAGRISQPAGAAAPSSATTTGNLDPKGVEFLKLKERILLLERVILHTIGFGAYHRPSIQIHGGANQENGTKTTAGIHQAGRRTDRTDIRENDERNGAVCHELCQRLDAYQLVLAVRAAQDCDGLCLPSRTFGQGPACQ
jgi:hypothetical protein